MKMQTFRKPHQWLTFWLEKYIDVLNTLKFESETRKKYWAVLKEFLEANPGNPRNLQLADIHAFIAESPEERLIPVTLFFKHIAPSKPHLEMLKEFGGSAKPPVKKMVNSEHVEKFIKVLEQQELSERTAKNYLNAVTGYLKWAEEKSYPVTKPHIDEYIQFLTDIRQLAPRTITMHQTAVRLYYGIDKTKKK